MINMNFRGFLIVCSLLANIVLVFSFRHSLRRASEARQLLLQQEGEMARLRELTARLSPNAGGLTASGLGAELALLQKIKLAVTSEMSKNRSRDFKCKSGTGGEVASLLNSMTEYKKRLDLLLLNNQKEAKDRDELVARVEEEARKMKDELMVLCAR